MTGSLILSALIAGSRPAFFLSSFRPVRVLKGGIKAGRSATLPRKVLVVAQFTCSVALIISTIIIYRQIEHAKNRPTGYDVNRLIVTDRSDDLEKNYDALKNGILQSGVVSSVTFPPAPLLIFIGTVISISGLVNRGMKHSNWVL